MANDFWQLEEERFLQAIRDVKIPNESLENVDRVILKDKSDFDKISNGGGCYWIWTNEPVLHTLHKNDNPPSFDDGEIIYNGIAKDDVKGRIKHHLLGHVDAGWSGISMDIYFDDTRSHRKKALANNGKVPYLKEKTSSTQRNVKADYKSIRSTRDLLKIHLSQQEIDFISKNRTSKIHFRNGIDILDDKHKPYEFRAYFITGLSSLYLDFIEKKWREMYGLPRLCSYKSGR